MAAVQKIYTVLDTEPDLSDAPDARPLPDVHGRVEFDHVSFGYGGGEVLHDVDFTIAPGGTVALVGGQLVFTPVANFNGTVDDVNEDRQTLKVMVSIFGRSTPVEIEFSKVDKMEE